MTWRCTFEEQVSMDSKVSTNAQARNHQKELLTHKKCLRTKNAGNRQKEQVTRELGCAIEHHLLKCFLSWTQIAHLGSDLHSCSKNQTIARKGKLLVTLKMLTNEHQGKPPEKASYPCHGCALLRINYLLIKKCLGFKSVYERTSKKPPERATYP